ncbi:hypothetical protein MLD38_013298 [Melastoma candidum]|uniref:Uncharacterized protein n=1 Tax=Melastoma candidum TaxID=119954 RepID=A0ACB9R8R5_9MYRT|nr:hypothetical protein MLD38_013298 [Melastoma candidum]
MGAHGISPSSPWDQPFTAEELDEIDAAADSVSATRPSRKRVSVSDPQHARRSLRLRRLPPSFSSPDFSGNTKESYPVMTFEGRISYSQTSKDVEKAAAELLKEINMLKLKNSRVVLGFDIEWKPTFRKGCAPGKAALMQICCSASFCYAMHIFHSGITPTLKHILEDDSVLKVGAGIANDATKIARDYDVSLQGFKELSDVAKKKLVDRTWGLSSLVKSVMHMELLKPKTIRLGNWEAAVLSEEKLNYAATDAFASWRLYHVLDSLPDVKHQH